MASCSAQLPNGSGDDIDEYEWKSILPPGHGFYPTDQEIITKYLKRRAQNLEIHAGIINDLDIYNYHPEELEAIALNQWNGRMYFFTVFKRKAAEGRRGDRAVGGGKGYWKASQAREKLKDGGGVVIGTKQPLVFHDGKGIKTSWLMTEFRFPENFSPLPLYNETQHELALCVIYYHGKRTTTDGNREFKSNNTNSMENLQSCNLIRTPRPNPNFTTASTVQNPNHPSSPAQNSNSIETSSLYPTQNPNFIATSVLQSPNHPSSPCQNNNFIATSSLYPPQNPNFNSTFTLQSPNHPPSLTQNSNFIAMSSICPTQNLNFNASFALQNPNHPPSLTQNYNFIATSSIQNPNHSLSFVQNPNFIITSSLQNPNRPLSSSQNSNFIATSSLQNFDYLQSSIENPNFIATSSQQNPNFPQYSLAQDSSLQDAWNELFSLFTDEEICSYDNEDIFQLRVLSSDSNDKDESS